MNPPSTEETQSSQAHLIDQGIEEAQAIEEAGCLEPWSRRMWNGEKGNVSTEVTRGATPGHSCLPLVTSCLPSDPSKWEANMDRKGEEVATRNRGMRKQESREGSSESGFVEVRLRKRRITTAHQRGSEAGAVNRPGQGSVTFSQPPLCLHFPSVQDGFSYPYCHVHGGCVLGDSLGSLQFIV